MRISPKITMPLFAAILILAGVVIRHKSIPDPPLPETRIAGDTSISGPPSAPPVSENQTADKVEVFKAKRLMILYQDDKIIRQYRVALGDQPVGPKRFQGDEKTPEGLYYLDYRNPQSRYHLSIHISYPSDKDQQYAGQFNQSPGGDIFIHGLPHKYSFWGKLHRLHDWTDGCIAVTNEEIEEIWKLCPDGIPIMIYP